MVSWTPVDDGFFHGSEEIGLWLCCASLALPPDDVFLATSRPRVSLVARPHWLTRVLAVFAAGEKPGQGLFDDATRRLVHATSFGARPQANLRTIAARVISNGPLRAKEASPFVSNKYPVIVRHGLPS